MDNQNNTTVTQKIQTGRKAPAPVYVTDWQLIAERADLEVRRYQLTAELARINAALEELGEVGK